MIGYKIEEIKYEDTKEFILRKHYAQRMPPVSYAFGLFRHDEMVGVLTIGKPASRTLCVGICGQQHAHKVYELNRLVTLDGLHKNALSYFVSGVMRKLKGEDLIIVSYADSGVGHHGYIYQATNFLYTGATKERTDQYRPGNKHHRHADDRYKHLRKVRTAKHRYVYFTGDKKKYMKLLNYKILPYPKGENKTYELGTRIGTKVLDKVTGRTWYE